jgi:hypothetical protein
VPMPGETTLVSAAVYAGTHHTLDITFIIAAAAAGAIFPTPSNSEKVPY